MAVLLGVVLGGWLTIRNQERQWHRDHEREWRDIRLSTYNEFASAYRQYVAFAVEPSALISAVPHPQAPGELMPFFDEAGRPYKEKLESTWIALRIVCQSEQTVGTGLQILTAARQVAAARANHGASDIPAELFQQLWAAQDAFIAAARVELGVAELRRLDGVE
ncbi:hypothetical protein [Nocardia sp. NPDC052112]|uniref:hypothetical protein n=1 Tax=Nocardia sp. NPDC052112 TaxID=3155646 RepID=UPI003427C95C